MNYLRLQQNSLIGNQIVLNNTPEHSLMSIVFELGYLVSVPRGQAALPETVNLTLSWAPYLGPKESMVEIAMLTGPGKSASGKMLWDPLKSFELFLKFSISHRETGPSPQMVLNNQAAAPDLSKLRRQIEHESQAKEQRLLEEIERLKKSQRKHENKPINMVPVAAPQIEPPAQVTPKFGPAAEPQQERAFLDTIAPTSSVYLTKKTTKQNLPTEPAALSRADKSRLVKSGIRGVMEYEQGAAVARPRLDIEAQDPLQAAIYTLQFLAYRSGNQATPRKMAFGLRFYNFPYCFTGEATVQTGEQGVPWVLVKEGLERELELKFEVEPAQWDHLDFAKYLSRKLTIELWDLESQMQLGFARVLLAETMRQGRPSVVVTKEYPVYEALEGEQIGSLQLLIRNQGVGSSARTQPSQYPRVISGSQARHKSKAHARVIEVSGQNPAPSIENEDARKKLRVSEFLKPYQQGNSEYWEKEKYLREVSIIRERDKAYMKKQVIQEYLSSAEKIHARTGQAHTFEYVLKNPHNAEECFTIAIQDGELTLVTDTAEWQWWISQAHYHHPPELDMVSAENSIILRPGESCPLVFKFLSFAPTSKMVSAWIHQSRGSPLSALELEVIPEAAPVDHIFRFYEPEDRTVRLLLPPFPSYTSRRPIVRCTLEKGKLHWESDNEISIELKVAPAPEITEFSVLVYEDRYCGELKAHWELKVHSLVGIDLNVKTGETTTIRLACPADEARTIKLFASDRSTILFPAPHDQPFSLLPRSVNSIPINVRSDAVSSRRIKIHAVDVFHKKLVHAWVLRLETAGDSYSQVYEIKAPYSHSTDKRVTFVNRSQGWALFHFRSSHPELLQLLETRLALESGAKGFLPVRVLGPGAPGQAEVCVFASDSEESIFERLQFNIQFT